VLTRRTNNRQAPLAAGQPQVCNLDLAARAVDQDVVTLEVPVHDGWIVCVQVQQTLQDLKGPALDGLLTDELVLLAVPAGSNTVRSPNGGFSRRAHLKHARGAYAGAAAQEVVSA
jgi:hypothetical protein